VTALSQRQLLDEGYEHYESTAIQLARENITAFCHYVMRDEYTGKPIDLAYFQEEWHYLADTYDRLVIWAFANSGKTQNLTVARTLFLLGQNPSLRFHRVRQQRPGRQDHERDLAVHRKLARAGPGVSPPAARR